MDGASKDDSVRILERMANADNRLRYVSEPDEGEVYATNKGFDLGKGEIYGIQASDDCYTPGALAAAVDFLLQHPEYVGVSGDAGYVDAQGHSLNRGVVTYRGQLSANTIRRLMMVRYTSCPVLHGSFFGWRERILRHGKLDPTFSVTPDWEFYLRLLDRGEQIGCLPRVQYHYTFHPGMGAVRYARLVEQQRLLLYQRYGIKWHHKFVSSNDRSSHKLHRQSLQNRIGAGADSGD